jgi:very-short-patch-repair endonuclease
VKFRRQHPFEQFILDFYAPEIHLAIEIDGDVHDDPVRKQYDRWREDILREHGLRVLRFANEEVALNVQDVVDHIRANIQALREQR